MSRSKISLTGQIIQYIKRNRLFEGARLPSMAVLSKQLKVGKDTLSSALLELQNEDIIEIRKNDGCYIKPTAWELLYRGTPNWARLADKSWFGDKNYAWQPKQPDAINISVGHLSDEFGFNSYIADAFEEAAKIVRSGSFTHNLDPLGRQPLKEAIQAFLRDYKGIDCDPSQIIYTLGSSQNLAMISQSLLNRNTPLCAAAPNPLSIMTVMDSYGVRLVEYEENDLDSLKSVLGQFPRAVLMIWPSYSYPSGTTISSDFREGLFAYARKRQLPVLEMDTYNDLCENSGYTLKAEDTNDMIIYGGTLMNVYTIGIPITWLVVPTQMVERFAALVAQNNPIPATLSPLVVELMMQESVMADYFRKAKKIFQERVELTRNLLKTHLEGYADWEDGNIGLDVWLKMKDPQYTQAVLSDPRLYVLSGDVFGKRFDNCLSICPCNQAAESLTKGIALMGEILSKYEMKK